jgi:hypothetical protein
MIAEYVANPADCQARDTMLLRECGRRGKTASVLVPRVTIATMNPLLTGIQTVCAFLVIQTNFPGISYVARSQIRYPDIKTCLSDAAPRMSRECLEGQYGEGARYFCLYKKEILECVPLDRWGVCSAVTPSSYPRSADSIR